ncbi:hypothetical protein BDR07DRAFT_1380313 [Suillus spraguei]|nr:hypothetical protein BDR07DRAFT_1380313 [Suillus spraguei]
MANSVTLPPPYDNIHASTTPELVKCSDGRLSLFFSFLRNKRKQIMILSFIHDIVFTPDFNPSSGAPTVDACAAALSPAKFSNLLEKPNIEGQEVVVRRTMLSQNESIQLLQSKTDSCSVKMSMYATGIGAKQEQSEQSEWSFKPSLMNGMSLHQDSTSLMLLLIQPLHHS